jgi:hypothetical protein
MNLYNPEVLEIFRVKKGTFSIYRHTRFNAFINGEQSLGLKKVLTEKI